MKVIIAGSRTFNNYKLLQETMDNLNIEVTEVVCGTARGADIMGEKWALNNGIAVKYFPANWKTEGRAAGINRNHKMGDYADYLVAFWDRESRGTKDMIDYMQQLEKPGTVIIFKNIKNNQTALKIQQEPINAEVRGVPASGELTAAIDYLSNFSPYDEYQRNLGIVLDRLDELGSTRIF